MPVEIRFNTSIIPPTDPSSEIDPSIELFQQSPFKFALQKSGELTDISLSILEGVTRQSLRDLFPGTGRRLFSVIDNQIGVASVRNKAICQLVAQRSVDAGIVGLDQVYESGLKDELVILRELRETNEWDLVLATPRTRRVSSIADILVVATQYPLITQAFFLSMGHSPTILQTHGSTEVMPLLKHSGRNIDGIVDLRVSGNTLEANGMQAWSPALAKVFPVLITNKQVISDVAEKVYLEKFM